MRLTALAAAICALGVTASPVSTPGAVDVEKRDSLAIVVWENIASGTGGRTQDLYWGNRGDCLNLGNGWPDIISAVQVAGGWSCSLWSYWNCDKGDGQGMTGRMWPVSAGFVEMSGFYAGANDAIKSIKCE